MDKKTIPDNLFNVTKITERCDSIMYINEFLKSFGEFAYEINMTHDDNGTGHLSEVMACGIKDITKEMIGRQFNNLNQIKEIYEEGLERL